MGVLEGIDFKGILFSNAGLGLAFVFAILLVLAVAYIVWQIKKGRWFGKFPVTCWIWERRAGRLMKLKKPDKGRAMKDEKGDWYYELKRAKATTQAFEFDYITEDNELHLLRLNRDEYHPFILLSKKATIRHTDGTEEEVELPKLQPVIDETFKHVYVNRVHKNFQRKPDMDILGRWGGLISVVVVSLCVFLILALVLKEMQPIVDSAASAGKALAAAAKSCNAAVGVAP